MEVNDDEHEIMHAINHGPEKTAKPCYSLCWTWPS